MAKTASQIQEERKAVSDYRNAVHEKQMAEVGAKNAARTAAVLNAAGHKTAVNPDTYEVSIVGTATPKTTTQQKLDLQNKKEQKAEAKAKTSAASNKYHAAKKEYDSYVKSDEYKKRLEDNDKKARQQEVVNYFLPPEMQQAPKVIQDDKEIQLRAAMEQAEQEYKAAEDNKVIESDLEAITGLSGDERKQLEQYAVNQIRDQNMPVEFQNIPFFKTAEQEASGLIGKIGKQRADELAETYMRQENEKFAQDIAAKGAEHAGTGFWSGLGASAATVPINLVAGLVGSVGQLQGAARNTDRYQTLDPNATGTALQTYTGAVRGKVGQNISGDVYDEEGKLIKDGGAFRGVMALGYQGAMSIADSAARAALGRVIGTVALNATDYAGKGRLVAGMAGSALAAANSFSQTLSEASARGATPKQAITLATATSAIEALSEKIPLDELVNTAAIGKQSGKEIVSRALKQAGIELTTEEISFAASILAETAILKEKSSYKTAIVKKILDGESPEAAKLNTLREILQEAKETAIVSAISGFGSSTGSSVLGNMLADTTPNAGTPEEIKQKALDEVRSTEAQKTAPEQQAATVAENAATDKTEAVAPAQQAAPNVSDIVADMVQKNNQQKQEQETSIEVPSGETKEQKRYDWENIFDEWEDDDEGGLWEYFQETKNIETPVQEQKKQDVFDVIADMVQENFVKQNEQERAKPNVSDIVADMLRKSTEAQQQEQAKATQPATPQQTVPVQKPVQPAEIPGANTFIKKDEPPKGKKIYLEYQSISPASSFFHPKEPSNFKGSDELNFTVNADGTLNWDQSKIDESYNTVGGYISKGFGYLYDMYVDGKKVTDANSDTFSGYYDMKKADVQIKPVLREISGGNFILSQKGELNLYSDNFVKPTQTAQQPAVTAEQAQEAAPAQQEVTQQPQTETRQPVQTETAPEAQQQEQDQAGRYRLGIKGTGAAEQNFTGKAEYQNLLSDDNVQRDRPGDVRPMEVPKTDSFGRRVSELVGNAAGAEITTDKMANTIEELVQEGALGFDVRHNQDSMNTAAKQIEQRGVAATKKQITNAVASGKIRDGDVEQAILLYAMYNSKDTPAAIDNASEILVDLATMANITGRNLQMFRLLRKMTPEGQVTTIRKTVQGNIDSMIKSGAVKKGYTTEIDPELLAEYRKAAGENMRAVSEEQKKSSAEKMKTIMDAIYAMEAAKMPTTFKAKWDAWRYMAMLGNVKTQVRNLAGNALFVPYKEVKDRTAALAEKMFVAKDKRTKAVFTDLELLEWARQDRNMEDVKNALRYSGKIGDDITDQKIRDGMQVFKNKGLDNVRKLVENVPAAGDMLFKNGYYARSLADFMRARGYRAADIQSGKVSAEVLNEARSYAVQEAMKATFNDANVLSDFFATGIHYKGDNPVGKVWNMAMEGVLPFRRTPANIAVRFEEYSPLGIANTLWKAVDPMKTGKYTAADVVDSLASSLTGSAAMALGFVLAKGLMGIKLTGSDLSEDEERQGHQEYAIEYADKEGNEYSYKIDWAAPANLPLFIGANIHDAIESRGENADVSKFTAFLRGLGNAFEPMLALSCLSGINDLFESARYANEDEALYTVAANIATGYITQGIPALTRQAAQAAQEVKRTTFSDSTDPTVRDIESTLAGVPFYGENFKTDKVNAWGEKESTGTTGERIINAFINPGTLKKIDNSALEQEISRLNKSQTEENVTPPYIPKVVSYTDKDGNKHNNHRMTEEEYQTLAQTQGQTARRILEAMINDTNYAAMTDEQKAKAMQKVYSYAKETAMQKAFPNHLGYPESWMLDLKQGNEAGEILRNITNSELNRTMSNLTTAWDNKYSTGVTDSYSRELEVAYDSYSKMTADQKRNVKEFATGTTAKYIEAREKGISHSDFISTAKNVNNVKGTGKNGTVRDIDRRTAIAKTAGLNTAEVDKLMKVYMPDYDKTDDSPETTELKYKYIREELDLSPREYASTYKAYLDGDKKAGKIRDIMALGYDYRTANALYKVYKGSMKQKLIDMYG